MSAIGLTSRQSQVLAFITAEVDAGRQPPTYDEMAVHIGIKSKAGIHRIIVALEKRGRIRRLPGCSRAIALLDGRVISPTPPPPAPAVERPRLGIPRPVAEQLAAYCDRRRVAARDVLAAALMAYMERHQ